MLTLKKLESLWMSEYSVKDTFEKDESVIFGKTFYLIFQRFGI